MFSYPVLLFPQHNSIRYQEYWYEPTILGAFTVIVTFCLDTLTSIKWYFKAPSCVSFRVFLQLYFVTAIFWVFFNCSCHVIWTIAIGYQHPMPLTLLIGYLTFMVQYTTLYFILSRDESWHNHLSIRFKPFIKSRIWCLLIDIQYKGLSLLFSMLPSELQWILAFVLPLVRELSFHVCDYIQFKTSKIDDGKDNLVIAMYGFSALYIAIRLGQTATNITSILILVVDFALNLYSCHDVIKLHRSIVPNIPMVSSRVLKKRDSALTKLLLTEIVEVLVPISYLLTMFIAYYGPNAEILGNIRNGCWHFKPIQHIGELVSSVTVMCLIDSSSAIIVGIWLWKTCSLNFLERVFNVIREKWDAIVGIMSNFLVYVS